ncbi:MULTISPECIES: sensor histidine kinase [Aeromicrobium]|uniref:sensor histidine kinase n=1 Tax=Aeromicrobium TaxID=2040 RepID=UPI00257CB2EE|nr:MULTISPECIES: ATP-binding protein [Aeromicrobium]
MRPRTLTGRLIASAVALVSVVCLLVALTATVIMRSTLMERLDGDLQQAVERAERVEGPGRGGGALVTDCGELPTLPPGQNAGSVTAVFGSACRIGVQITAAGGLSQLPPAAVDEMSQAEVGDEPRTMDLPGVGSYRVAATTNAAGDRVAFGLPTAGVDDTIGSLVRWEILLSLLGIGVAAVGARQIVRHQLRPLRQVAATAHEVAETPLASGAVASLPRVPDELTDPTSEVGRVGAAFNQMLGHVDDALRARHDSEQQVRRFLADASHELRTPLTTIRGYAELSRRTDADPTEAMARIESEVGRVTTLVEDMLLLARLDSGRALEQREVDLTHLVVEAVADARVVDPDRRWRLEVPPEPLTVVGDELRLHQAVTNLLTNATRHTPEGTTVTVRVLAGPTRVEVHDDGPGVPEDLQPVVWERFTRGDSSRTRSSGGAGLGMSLVRAIMLAHGGEASLTSRPGDTTFTLAFAAD